MGMTRRRVLAALAAAILTGAAAAEAQLAVSSNDNKLVLVNGVSTVVANPAADTITVIDLNVFPPRVVAEIPVPGSVVGPPLNVAIAPDESIALVTSAMKIDPADATKQVPDNRLSVVDLKARPPAVIATLETGKGPAGVSINRQGTLALVANRSEGTVSVFGISGKTLTPTGVVKLGDDKSLVSHPAISPDGKMALVTRYGDHLVSVLTIEGTKVDVAKRDMTAGIQPYAVDIASTGDVAVVANIGRGAGDADTVSLIDLRVKPPRVVDTITVGQTPEGMILSPDGKLAAVVVMNGSNKAKDSPYFNDAGKLVLVRVDGGKLSRVAEAPIGHWSQGAAFSADGKTILVQNMVEKDIQVFRWDGGRLTDSGQRIKVGGGAAGIRTTTR